MSEFSAVLIGDESLLIACGEVLLERGHAVRNVVSRDTAVVDWAKAKGIDCLSDARALPEGFDWLFSIANLSILPDDVLARAARGAVNFHDGPLPEYAGLNTPVWALLNRRDEHGITWHRISGGVDEGNILEARRFPIAPGETAFSLNSKCYAAGLEAFTPLVERLERGDVEGTPQDFTTRQVFTGAMRPAAGAVIDVSRPAGEIAALVHALDFGDYWNPVTRAKLRIGARWVLVGQVQPYEGAGGQPGEVLANTGSEIAVQVGDGALLFEGLTDTFGRPLDVARLAVPGDVIAPLDAAEIARFEAEAKAAAKADKAWRARLAGANPVRLALATEAETPDWQEVRFDTPLTRVQSAALAVLLARQSTGDAEADLALGLDDGAGLLTPWVPLRAPEASLDALETALAKAEKAGAFARDLVARAPEIAPPATPTIALGSSTAPVPGACVNVRLADGPLTVQFDHARLDAAARAVLTARIEALSAALAEADASTPLEPLLTLPASERHALLEGWNQTDTPFDADQTVHGAFEAQAAATPDATALVFEDKSLTYGDLNAQANALARALASKGVGAGERVGLFVPRSLDMLIGALAILKAGAAYVPLDPDYPADRITHYIADSGAKLVLTDGAALPDVDTLDITAQQLQPDPANLAPTAPDALAYLIYTSGSTGLPKGVMVSHRNVSNFFTGMDAVVDKQRGAVWLAVTSLSFDISVLELFYTLARGFKVVISGGATKAAVSQGKIAVADRPIDFSLYYWGNDDGQGPKKYELLLEGAKFADANGFNAVWTPERHFHAFGGPYPNPSVTGAAVAAVTKNVSVRAGSCVAPLHHPARIAEEWAIIDNLTNGRAGLGVASGWHPDDFVLRPENTPPKNRAAMFEAVDKVRALWRGEAVDFPTESGTFAVTTQPRPVSAELPVWVTTAGNPDTWREAGEKGANVLTHLLGQSIEEVGEKIKIYHAALQAAGHDRKDFKVTIMLHTYLAETREESAAVARGPLKDYLRSAAGLIKQYAWAFPAFKRPKGVSNPFELDIRDLGGEEVEAILDFAFERYFEESGLFGTVADGVARAEQLKRIGVDEIACLIDYGIPSGKVMEGLKPLAEVLQAANAPTQLDDDDFSVAAQIIRHGVTHLQCTPSMARILTMDDEARASLSHLRQLLLGGEALSGDLVAELRGCTDATLHNMYGPTETTIWSTHAAIADTPKGIVGIGKPIANTQVYVLDDALAPVPVGCEGELLIGGDGVTPGYWQRAETTADRFIDNPFGAGRLYRTGDVVRWTPDGTLEFLGRSDHQVKIRGQRIELGEIETRIVEAGVRQAVVMAREDTPGDIRLAAYLLGAFDEARLRAELAQHLPEVMVPAHIVGVDAFPLTPNGKIDRKALPVPTEAAKAVPRAAPVAPRSDTEKLIAGVWGRVLGVDHIGAGDNFFALGGHSLLAVQAHREIRQVLGDVKLSITDIFRFPVLGDLARHIAPDEPAEAAPEDTAQKAETMSKRRAMRARRRR